MENRISVTIVTFNEEENIERCLNSVKNIADEIVVVDSFSTDKTEDICNKFGATFITNEFPGHKEQKNFAFSKVRDSYILSLDADEALSPELEQSILSLKKGDPDLAEGYTVNRLTYYQGSWIKHSGWYPDKKLRLVKSGSAEWKGQNPHDMLQLTTEGEIRHLKGDLYHYSFRDLADHASRTNRYSTIAAVESYREKRSFSYVNLIFNPLFIFIKKFVFQLGFLDGYNGYLIAAMAAYGKFLKYAKLRELYKQKR